MPRVVVTRIAVTLASLSLGLVVGCVGRGTAVAPQTPALATPPTATSAEAPPPDGPYTREECGLLHQQGRHHAEKNEWQRALTLFDEGRARCPGDLGFSVEGGAVLAMLHQSDRAAEVLTTVVNQPGPPPFVFKILGAIRPELSPTALAKLRQLGTVETAPVYVPDIAGEYFWIANFGCARGPGKLISQSLIAVGRRSLDAMFFACPDQQQRTLYFDFSADPIDKAMKQRLGPPPPQKPPG